MEKAAGSRSESGTMKRRSRFKSPAGAAAVNTYAHTYTHPAFPCSRKK